MGPQCEDGYTKIANELLEALCSIRIPGESMQIFLTILRKTYGYGKKKDKISISQFVESTGIRKTHIARSLDKLIEVNVIIAENVTNNGNKTSVTYQINKHYDTWKALPKKGTLPILGTKVTQNGNKSNPKWGLQKKERKKENNKVELLEICQAWKAYIEMRKLIKKPMTDYAMQLRVNDLFKLMAKGEDPLAVLNQSISNSWQDLYQVKDKSQQQSINLPDSPKIDTRRKEAIRRTLALHD